MFENNSISAKIFPQINGTNIINIVGILFCYEKDCLLTILPLHNSQKMQTSVY